MTNSLMFPTTCQALISRIRSNFPPELRTLNQWVVWKLEQRPNEKKPTKVPYAVTGAKAESDNPSTWASFDAACAAFLAGDYNGVGFMFSEVDPYAGIDFDNCVAGEHIDLQAQAWVLGLGSYSEYSQSETGIHTIVIGKLPGGGRKSTKHGVEMYDNRRFFVVTGDHVAGTSMAVCERQAELTELHDIIFPPKAQAQPAPRTNGHAAIPADDEALLQRMFAARNGADIEALWRGNLAAYNNDESAADLALCNHLAFWTGNDAERMDRLFRQSGLMRDKWDRPARTGETYGQGTIARAIAATATTYTGQRTNGSTNGQSNGAHHVNGNGAGVQQARGSQMAARKRDIFKLREDLLQAAKSLSGDFVAECADRNQSGDARLLTSILTGNVTYDHAGDSYYFWNNIYWEPDPGGNIHQITSDVLTATYKRISAEKYAELLELQQSLASSGGDADEATAKRASKVKGQMGATAKRAQELFKHGAVDNVLKFARSTMNLGTRGDCWDANPRYLGTQSHIIDLMTGKPVPPDPLLYIRTVAPVEYDPAAQCPTFERMISEIFDGNVEKIAYVKRKLGYAISGECTESDFYVWYGKHGRNGKEAILEAVRAAVGERLAGVVNPDLLLKSNNQRGADSPTEAKMVLYGRRIAWASETEQGRQFDTAVMKDLSGGHIMHGRHNHGKQIEWRRSHTLFFLTNFLPHVNSQALAEWDRIKLLEFPLSFVSEPDPTKPHERKKDPTLVNRIVNTELAGVLNWLIAGQLEWRADGLMTPTVVKAATAKYKSDEDSLGHFITQCCVTNNDAHTLVLECKPAELFSAYKFWMDGNGKPLGKSTFYKHIEDRGFARVTEKGNEKFKGIGLAVR